MIGGNPPFPVKDGFFRRIWSIQNIVQVYLKPAGIFIVKFVSIEARDKVLQQKSFFFFDKKPLILKDWSPDTRIDRDAISQLHIWVQLPSLHPKYWGAPSLSKIGSLLGTPLRMDRATKAKVKIDYARLLVEVQINAPLPDYVELLTENGVLVRQ